MLKAHTKEQLLQELSGILPIAAKGVYGKLQHCGTLRRRTNSSVSEEIRQSHLAAKAEKEAYSAEIQSIYNESHEVSALADAIQKALEE
jgi:hypothetical protein